MVAVQTKRSRRSGDEIRDLLLRAARETFAEFGYSGATTREIARRAAVTEATLFRTYTSKEGLFEAAILGPFDEFLNSFADQWMRAPVPGGTPEEVLPQFVQGVYDLVRDHRDLFAAVTYSNVLGERTQVALDRLELLGETIARTHGLPFDVQVSVRIATTAVVAVALMSDGLFPETSGVTTERIVTEMSRMLIGAARYDPAVVIEREARS